MFAHYWLPSILDCIIRVLLAMHSGRYWHAIRNNWSRFPINRQQRNPIEYKLAIIDFQRGAKIHTHTTIPYTTNNIEKQFLKLFSRFCTTFTIIQFDVALFLPLSWFNAHTYYSTCIFLIGGHVAGCNRIRNARKMAMTYYIYNVCCTREEEEEEDKIWIVNETKYLKFNYVMYVICKFVCRHTKIAYW